MEKYVVGIDLGGTKISGALATLEGKIILKDIMATNAHEGEEAVLKRIIALIDKIMDSGKVHIEEIRAIGIGSPGPLNAKTGTIIETPNLPFKNFNLTEPIAKKFQIPVYLDNDANVAALGEYALGAGKGTENMIYITVSTGVGGGAILNGKIYRGSNSNALEVGHTTVEPKGYRCNCGNYGCVEAMASGTAIAKRAEEAIERGLDTTLTRYDKVTSYEVFQEAETGDKVAQDILNSCLSYLGICVANVINSFDPDMVVIGGGVSKGGKVVFHKVKEVVNERCMKAMAENCSIVPAKLGVDAGVIGAVVLAIGN